MIRTERAVDEHAIRFVETAALGKDREAQIVDSLRELPQGRVAFSNAFRD